MTDSKYRRQLALEIAAVSFAILFQELALIRWIPSQVRVAAYFPNIVLMSAFLGLGLGCLRARARMPSWLWPISMLLLLLVSSALSRVAFTQESDSVHLWLLYFDLSDPLVVRDIRLPILVLFAFCTLTFVPLGHYLATRIREWTALGETLRGYTFDLSGSLAGIIAFSTLSMLATPPATWFAIVALAASLLLGSQQLRQTILIGMSGAAIVAIVALSSRNATFSPYYSISTGAREGLSGPVVLTNGSLHQYPAPVTSRRNHPGLTPQDRRIREGYPLPYNLMKRTPERVLVLGAGTGNDVAVALARGAKEIDAVEIDPVITDLGRKIHPNHPYLDPRVRVIRDDARSYLERTNRRYDLVVFGTLDSMTKLSALSTVRLDNFVYTREGLEAAKRVLRPDGGVAMYFMVGAPYIGERLAALHQDVFGKVPATIHDNYVMFNLIVMSGSAFDHVPRRLGRDATWNAASVLRPTDDWPYLYTANRTVPRVYLEIIAAIAVLALLATAALSRSIRQDISRGRVDLEMLALGAAFLLLEARAVTQMSLVWGATWVSSAVVFGSIVVVLLAATVLMDHRPIASGTSLAGLTCTLLVSWLFPASAILGASAATRLALSVVLVGAPLFFASMLFAVRFEARVDTDSALGWNLLGAVLGGLLEFSSMAFGIRLLALLALALYLSTLLTRPGESSIRLEQGSNASDA